MVKLATAREIRTYGPRLGRSRAEYINAGLYLFATVVLIGGFTATGFSWEPRSGLVLILLALVLITAVNVHDLVAHLAGIDYRPSGSDSGFSSVFLGNLFRLPSVLNSLDQSGSSHSGLKLLGERWVWLGISGAICLFVGGLMNVVKVFNFVQITGLRLEKLRGGAQDRLLEGREGYLPLVAEEERIRKMEADEASSRPKPRAHLTSKAGAGATETVVVSSPTPYKDVLVGQS
ncbi:unnamed protein product [Arabidopsis arenosa]|uniref:Uncharacterized protein n=1 Tax=Arabidopsis arenosa TaxID=38785 RepID=A0A8S2ARP2_ARAAE|nr:unnamed protein product [Arabidopsis arenosa]